MLYIYTCIDNCIGGVMVGVLALSAHNRVRVVELNLVFAVSVLSMQQISKWQ